jgi:hypothetical protein
MTMRTRKGLSWLAFVWLTLACGALVWASFSAPMSLAAGGGGGGGGGGGSGGAGGGGGNAGGGAGGGGPGGDGPGGGSGFGQGGGMQGQGSQGGQAGAHSSGGGQDFAPVRNPVSGRAFTLRGEVLSIISEAQGQGLVVLSQGRAVIVYGLGPDRFWRTLGLARPAPGETVRVTGHTLDYNGVKVNLASSLELPGRKIVLRDPTTGRAAWN